eukprot:364584-Chlamydomonas_euryale.AAC.16
MLSPAAQLSSRTGMPCSSGRALLTTIAAGLSGRTMTPCSPVVAMLVAPADGPSGRTTMPCACSAHSSATSARCVRDLCASKHAARGCAARIARSAEHSGMAWRSWYTRSAPSTSCRPGASAWQLPRASASPASARPPPTSSARPHVCLAAAASSACLSSIRSVAAARTVRSTAARTVRSTTAWTVRMASASAVCSATTFNACSTPAPTVRLAAASGARMADSCSTCLATAINSICLDAATTSNLLAVATDLLRLAAGLVGIIGGAAASLRQDGRGFLTGSRALQQAARQLHGVECAAVGAGSGGAGKAVPVKRCGSRTPACRSDRARVARHVGRQLRQRANSVRQHHTPAEVCSGQPSHACARSQLQHVCAAQQLCMAIHRCGVEPA